MSLHLCLQFEWLACNWLFKSLYETFIVWMWSVVLVLLFTCYLCHIYFPLFYLNSVIRSEDTHVVSDNSCVLCEYMCSQVCVCEKEREREPSTGYRQWRRPCLPMPADRACLQHHVSFINLCTNVDAGQLLGVLSRSKDKNTRKRKKKGEKEKKTQGRERKKEEQDKNTRKRRKGQKHKKKNEKKKEEENRPSELTPHSFVIWQVLEA